MKNIRNPARITIWLQQYAEIDGTYTISEGGVISVTGSVSLNAARLNARGYTRLPVEFDRVTGDFFMYDLAKLTSLEGSPREVGGSFCCQGCSALTTLMGAPRTIGLDFNCYNCPMLTSLVGGPTYVGKTYCCQNCAELSTLEGIATHCYDLDIRYLDKLTTINRLPNGMKLCFIDSLSKMALPVFCNTVNQGTRIYSGGLTDMDMHFTEYLRTGVYLEFQAALQTWAPTPPSTTPVDDFSL